jgi:hypothetical protein
MAEILIYKGPHWMDNLTQQEIDDFVAENEYWMDKYNARLQRGDIVEIQENGFWENRGWGIHAYWLLKVPDRTKAQALQFAQAWNRNFTKQRTLNNTTNHIYEYTVTLTQTSISGNELFKANELVQKTIPKDCSILSKSANQVSIRLEPLLNNQVIAGKITPIQRRDNFEEQTKDELSDLSKTIRRKRFHFLVDEMPASIKNKFLNNEFVSRNWSIVQPYLEDKGLI